MFKDHAYRTVTGKIDNQSGETLELEPPGEFEWGQWLEEAGPSEAIKSIAPNAKSAIFIVESARYMTGCTGRLSFKVGKTDNRWEITWHNPFIGWNEYKQYINGQEYAEVANSDKEDDNLAMCTYVCPDPTKVKYPPAKPVKGDTNDAVVAPDQRAKVEPAGAEVFVIITCKQDSNPATPPFSSFYWMMHQWSELYVKEKVEGQQRFPEPVVPLVASGNRAKDRATAKERILAAYKNAVDKLNEIGRPGMIIHAVGHGGVGNDPNDKQDFSKADFDFGAQLGGFSTHVLQISNYTFDSPIQTKKDGSTDMYKPDSFKGSYEDYAAEEADNYKFLKEVAKEFDRLKVPARVRLLTCSVGSKFDFIHRLAYEWNIWTEGYTKKVYLQNMQGDWHIGFNEGGRWQEDAVHNLPKTNIFPEPKKSFKEEMDEVIK